MSAGLLTGLGVGLIVILLALAGRGAVIRPATIGRMTEWTGAPRLQIGHCLLERKPLILLVPDSIDIPEKLAAVCDVIERYNYALAPESIHEAAKRGMEKIGRTAVKN